MNYVTEGPLRPRPIVQYTPDSRTITDTDRPTRQPSTRRALDTDTAASRGLEAPYLRNRIVLGRRAIGGKMPIDIITAAMQGGAVGDRPVDRPRAGRPRHDLDHRALGDEAGLDALSDPDEMGATVEAVDDQEMSGRTFIHETAREDATDQRRGIVAPACEHHLVGERPITPADCKFALHRAHDIAARSHAPQRVL